MNLLLLSSVFAKATPEFGRPGFARDAHGLLIRWEDHGKQDSAYGWQVDHFPIAKCNGGSDDLSNLRPLHCKVNASLGGLLGAERNAFRDAARRPEGLLSRMRRG